MGKQPKPCLTCAEYTEIAIRARAGADFSGFGLRSSLLCRRNVLRVSRYVLSKPLGADGNGRKVAYYAVTEYGRELLEHHSGRESSSEGAK